jgi:hypothetical protein
MMPATNAAIVTVRSDARLKLARVDSMRPS